MFILCLLVLATGLCVGGASLPGMPGDFVVQVVSIPLALAVLAGRLRGRTPRLSRGEILLLLLGPAVAVAQLVPLPPAVWELLPRADLRLAPFDALGMAPDWRPASLDVEATGLALMSLLPPTVFFIGIRMLKRSERRALLLAAIALLTVGVFLGLAQLAGGPASPLRFYAMTNPSEAVGFFANRNHFAASLYVGVLFAAPFLIESGVGFLAARRKREVGAEHLVVLMGAATLTLLFCAAVVMTRSRAGAALALAAVVGIGVLLVLRPHNRWRRTSIVLFAGLFAGVGLFAAQAGLGRMLDRLASDTGVDGRFAITRNTLAAAEDFFPFGSGLGSFPKVYALYEESADLIPRAYVNAAHDDWLQLLLETGAVALVVAALVLAWVIGRGVDLFRRPDLGGGHLDLSVRRSAFLAVILLAVHSTVDYPLRTAAGMMLFALAAGLTGTRRHRSRDAAAAEPEVLPP
ncbi:O-antigen ligase family protein [Oharaeibacter diazotrophicus]|uniref:O-antigen ligase n=1 Tax=Oharaeibacter diazotrophicus TaxID=1920512 RepID=A0A4R6R9L0_9HYPH|nr:O-antigen ligase family protein [Oharaeibacter diazotrophicus]TDP82306.1 O-antigen ligase [Oharaeibacter diazotrophicus]BBE72931.1 o-antigen ligase [Pleomorphomonas sp. SM30]GLS76969.1 hypothetical protein GCM10007904_23060 [Oharaeibacter diazotrophicus]